MLQWEGHDIELVDTAGWIRRTKLAAYDESGERLYCLQCRMLRSGTLRTPLAAGQGCQQQGTRRSNIVTSGSVPILRPRGWWRVNPVSPLLQTLALQAALWQSKQLLRPSP